jgi:hypothetical protein
MLNEVETSLIFRRRQHKAQSEILRLRFAPLRMTKTTWSIALLATIPAIFATKCLLQLLESAGAVGGLKDVAG